MFKHILCVPTDGSLFSRDAVRKAVSVAKAGAKISALYVKLPPPAHYWATSSGSICPNHRRSKSFRKEAQGSSRFRHRYHQEAGVECTKTSLTHEHIYQAIIDEATKSNCDLIFMASHGRRGIDALVLGSETHKVLTALCSKIPVLVFHNARPEARPHRSRLGLILHPACRKREGVKPNSSRKRRLRWLALA